MKLKGIWRGEDLGYVVLVFPGVVLITLMVQGVFPYEEYGWYFTVYVASVAFIISYLRFKIADDQLVTSKKQLKIATRKEDLDRYLTGMELLARKDLASQLFGVRILTLLLDTDLARNAKISLGDVLRENWGPGKTEGDREVHSEVRDEIIKTLYRIDKQLNLSLFDLSGTNLSGKDLSGVKLSGANLDQAKLSGTNLSGMNLIGTNLNGADLSGANLSQAKLSGTNLSDANLSCTNLSGVDLSVAILSRGNLGDVNLSSVDLSGTNLSGLDLSGEDLSKANLSSANLSGANLSEVHLNGANLSEANLSGVDLSEAYLSDVDLSHANLSLANFQEARSLNRIKSFGGIWANKGSEPIGLPDKLMEEVQKNLK